MNPYPAPNSTLVMDNTPIHHGGHISELCDAVGRSVQYLMGLSLLADMQLPFRRPLNLSPTLLPRAKSD